MDYKAFTHQISKVTHAVSIIGEASYTAQIHE